MRPGHRLIELTYSNAAPLERNGKKIKLSEIFTFVQPTGRALNAFSTSWIENVYPQSPTDPTPPPRAIVTAQVVIGSIPPTQRPSHIKAPRWMGWPRLNSDFRQDALPRHHLRPISFRRPVGCYCTSPGPGGRWMCSNRVALQAWRARIRYRSCQRNDDLDSRSSEWRGVRR
jgi:hypothetical protein